MHENVLCFSGHSCFIQNKSNLQQLKIKMYEEIDKAIKNGTDTFYFGACCGFELVCANLVLSCKKIINFRNPQYIKLIAIIPYEEQANDWSNENRELYFDTLAKCDDVILLNTKYKKGCYYQKNRYMIEHSSKLICYYNGSGGILGYTINYAQKHNLQITNLYDIIK